MERAWLGRVPYAEALERQRTRREAILAGEAEEALWALEHDPVITTGRREAGPLPDPTWLEAQGIALCKTERGGLATWHGPGQLVVYALINAGGRGLGPRGLVSALEDGVLGCLRDLGLSPTRRDGHPGVWVPSPTSPAGLDKICAVGLHFRRGVSMHGLALNLDPDPWGFSLFTPCGITDAGVTSVARQLGSAPSPKEASAALLEQLVSELHH